MQSGLPPLDPIEDMKIKSKELEKVVRRVEVLEQRLFGHPLANTADLPQLIDLCVRKTKVSALPVIYLFRTG